LPTTGSVTHTWRSTPHSVRPLEVMVLGLQLSEYWMSRSGLLMVAPSKADWQSMVTLSLEPSLKPMSKVQPKALSWSVSVRLKEEMAMLSRAVRTERFFVSG